ncbi:YdcK family protein [Trabulsiella odontotermitis]|uniref:YdcK family protein n=1 Tax=Trabulsiella odontotermitis TaxID=379893 RepID=UPI0024B6B293|nr:YdcK family protein [Trabulsiella odontotermitis]WHP33369.1 YdcK family protein [Trabulsiella odontotermitis]
MNKYCLSKETRQHHYPENGENRTVTLRQIVALCDFADVTAGTTGGWIDNESALSQQGNCWIYNSDSVVFAGARIEDNARLLDTCSVSHLALISDNVTIQASQIRGECHLFGDACVLQHCEIIAARGLTPDAEKILQIYEHAIVSRSRIVHQAQIYGEVFVNQAFVEHRAEIFGSARIEGNEENNVWICDCASVSGHARIIAGRGEDAIPTLRYGAVVTDDAVVEGNCVLKQRVRICGHAWLQGGPLLLDDNVVVHGRARIRGDVIIEHDVDISGDAVIETFDDEQIHLRGQKVIGGDQRITRTPLLGSL